MVTLAVDRYKIVCLLFVFTLLAAASYTALEIYVKNRMSILLADYEDPDNSTNTTAIAAEIIQFKDKMDGHMYIYNAIKKVNYEQKMNNELLSGLTEYPSSFIVIHVNDDLPRFLRMLQSLSKVVAITRSMIIFVHECYSDQVNELIWSIEFARYVQIFYPYSLQLLPQTFPGNDEKFCKDGYVCSTNDNRRNSNYTNQKHFWWWMMNFVFDELADLKHNPYYYLFLKYDQIVAADLIFVFERMVDLMYSVCPQCEIMNFGARRPSADQFHVHSANFIIEAFGSTESIYGIAFNRSLWNKIKSRRRSFCYFNDYRWEESLKFISSKMPQGYIESFSPEGPRVISTACNTEEFCNASAKYEEAGSFYKLVSRGLFPILLDVKDGEINVNITATGHWEDVRDKELCMLFTEKTPLKFSL